MAELNKNLYPGIFNNYINNNDEIMEFFRYNPFKDNSFEARMDEISNKFDSNKRAKLTQILEEYNRNFLSYSEVRRSLEKLKDPKSTVIITGQQPGLLSGPLFTVYKILTAIKLARQLENTLSENIVPVFWLASEDHDFNEVNFLNFKDLRGNIEEFKLFKKTHNIKAPIGEVELKEEGDRFLYELNAFIEKNFDPLPEHYEKWMNIFRDSFENSFNLPHWTGCILMHLFAPYGLLVVDPMDKKLKEMSNDILLQSVDLKDGLYNEVTKKGEDILKKGYNSGLHLRENHSGLFYHHHGARKALVYEKGRFKAGEGEFSFESEELKEAIRENPENFSPNVSLRPIVQDYIFPTLTYVAGPGELSYFVQLKDLYEKFLVKMPVIYPRERYLLIESRVEEIMDKYELKLEDIFFSWPEKKENIFLNLSNLPLDDLFNKAAGQMKKEHQNLVKTLSQEFPEIEKLEEKNWNYIRGQLDHLREKTKQYNRKNNRHIQKELDFVKINLYPYDRPQERFFSMSEYLIHYDTKIIQKILDLPLEPEKVSSLKIE